MSVCGSGGSEGSCSAKGKDNRGSIVKQPESSTLIPEPITCPYQKALMLSMRLQGIIMQQMKEEIMKNRRVFKVYLRPTKQYMEAKEARENCSGNVDMVEELVNQLGEDLDRIRREFENLQGVESKRLSREE